MDSTVKYHVDADKIGHLVLDVPAKETNNISSTVLEEISEVLEIAKNSGIKALIIKSGKPNIFSAGADLDQFELLLSNKHLLEEDLRRGHETYEKVRNLPFPTIALIHGMCLGGGLELALACQYRVVTDHLKTVLGFPEVFLDIIPGWGGTQRLPRLIGLRESLDMILSGKYIRADKSYEIKLADAIVPYIDRERKTKDFIETCLTENGRDAVLKKRSIKSMKDYLWEDSYLGRFLLFYFAKKDLDKKVRGRSKAPYIALNLIKETYSLPLKDGLDEERQAFVQNANTEFVHAKNIISLFLAREKLKQDASISIGAKPLDVIKTAVIGAGVMGNNIAWLLSYYEYPVVLKEVNSTALKKGLVSILSLYEKFVRLKKLKKNEADERIKKISPAETDADLKDVDIVFEATIENIDLKRKLFKELEEYIKPEAIICSNTSSLKISDLSKSMKNPGRLVGVHFFNPPSRMPLVEIVQGDQTSPQAIATAVDMCKKLDKIPLVVKDCTGFLVNRIIVLGLNELMMILQETHDVSRLEKIMINYGSIMGWFALSDEVGNDVTLKVMQSLEQSYGERMKVPKIIELMNQDGLLGRKSGKGFYLFPTKELNSDVSRILSDIPKNSVNLTDEEILKRCLFAMINESARCLQEGVVANAESLDVAMILGAGLPAFRGGLLHHADELGIKNIVDQMKVLESSNGVRFRPCELLIKMAEEDKSFIKK